MLPALRFYMSLDNLQRLGIGEVLARLVNSSFGEPWRSSMQRTHLKQMQVELLERPRTNAPSDNPWGCRDGAPLRCGLQDLFTVACMPMIGLLWGARCTNYKSRTERLVVRPRPKFDIFTSPVYSSA